jgi:hypothetical protein
MPRMSIRRLTNRNIVEGATHIDLYDRPQFVTPAVAKLTAFFGRNLGQSGGSK